MGEESGLHKGHEQRKTCQSHEKLACQTMGRFSTSCAPIARSIGGTDDLNLH